jgi:peptidoglycan hydrolase-like protein with peptidoglycan-binding domain
MPLQPVSVPTPAQVRDLKIGDKGDDVKALQVKLGITADGIFGLKTKKAVLNIQVKNGLRADGIVGTNTRKILGL